jgi:hypothetical protein
MELTACMQKLKKGWNHIITPDLQHIDLFGWHSMGETTTGIFKNYLNCISTWYFYINCLWHALRLVFANPSCVRTRGIGLGCVWLKLSNRRENRFSISLCQLFYFRLVLTAALIYFRSGFQSDLESGLFVIEEKFPKLNRYEGPISAANLNFHLLLNLLNLSIDCHLAHFGYFIKWKLPTALYVQLIVTLQKTRDCFFLTNLKGLDNRPVYHIQCESILIISNIL